MAAFGETGKDMRFSFILSDTGTEVRAAVRGAGTDFSLAASEDGPEVSGRFSLGVSDERSMDFVLGSLVPTADLALLLDPMALRLPGFDAAPGIPDLGLDSSLGGLAFSSGFLGFFALEKGGLGTGSPLIPDPTIDDEEAETGPAQLAASGVTALFPAGDGSFGISFGLGRSSKGAAASTWYDAGLPGLWPRSVASLRYAMPSARPRVVAVLAGSSSIDEGTGLAFRLDAAGAASGGRMQTSVAVRSPRFLAWNEKGDLLARGLVDVQSPPANGLTLGFRGTVEARTIPADPTPRLERSWRLRVEKKRDRGIRTVISRLEGSWTRGPDEASCGTDLRIRAGADGRTAALHASAALDWTDSSIPSLHEAVVHFAGRRPDLAHGGFGFGLPVAAIPGVLALSMTIDAAVEMKDPFANGPSSPFVASGGLKIGLASPDGYDLALRWNLDGRTAPSPEASLAAGRSEISATLSIRLRR